jgi:hypothetical protein
MLSITSRLERKFAGNSPCVVNATVQKPFVSFTTRRRTHLPPLVELDFACDFPTPQQPRVVASDILDAKKLFERLHRLVAQEQDSSWSRAGQKSGEEELTLEISSCR